MSSLPGTTPPPIFVQRPAECESQPRAEPRPVVRTARMRSLRHRRLGEGCGRSGSGLPRHGDALDLLARPLVDVEDPAPLPLEVRAQHVDREALPRADDLD